MESSPHFSIAPGAAVRQGRRNPVRIGVYICHCGVNIAGRVDVEALTSYARELDGVAVSRDYRFMCSDPGQKLIEEDIKGAGLTRVVVASCSPRIHEKTFQAACRRAELNPYLFQMASIREQVSWVTQDPHLALEKAKSLVRAAVSRIRFHETLPTRSVPVHPDIMVVGGGIAGMQAALDIGNSGRKVYLVERGTTLGGHMLQFDKTFPTLDCAACIGTPKMVEVAQDPNIEMLTYSEVTEIEGFIGNYTVKVRRKPRYVASNCTGCGECASACPVTVPSEWDQGLAGRKAIYRAFPQAVPITFCIDKKDRAPCMRACPAGANIQGYVQLIGAGKYKEALRLILETIPLPGVLGRVCPHPCEDRCRRSEKDAPVAVRDLKRFVADQVDLAELAVTLADEKEERVAIIGSGPAGLTVARDLRLLGYRVTIFEAMPVLGGMPRLGIPEFRLPGAVLDREIQSILDLGIDVKTGVRFGADINLADLERQGFKAVFIAVGAHEGIPLSVPGAGETASVIDAVGFLRDVKLGKSPPVSGNVVVIGGGNVAVDAARTALRLESGSVRIVYRRREAEMPAFGEEIEAAKREGVRFTFLSAPVRVLCEDGRITGLVCIRNEPGQVGPDGRCRPEPVPGSEFVVECNTVIAAIGQKVGSDWRGGACGDICTPRGSIEVNPRTCQTSIKNVFAAGDAVTGPATVIEAIAAAHSAARNMDRYLRGEALDENRDDLPGETARDWRPLPDGTPRQERELITHVSGPSLSRPFDEDTVGFSEDQALREAGRCLNCGICCECMECVKACEAKAVDHSMPAEERDIRVGSIILATGYDLMDPSVLKPYGHGRFPNVFTSLEFERLCNATGPTGGKILMRDENGKFHRPPRSVGLVHCAGSRDARYHEYCSRVCCMYALKYSHLIKEKVGHETRVYDFYIDLRCFGKGYEEFLTRCQKEGTIFIRGKVAEIRPARSVFPDAEDLLLIAEDTLLGERVEMPVDMAILCMAMEPRRDAVDVGRIFGVSTGGDGFFLEQHPKLAPLDTASDGIFLAGACQAPKDIPDTVAQASGAAAKALSLSVRGEVVVPSAVSWIDPQICAGCKICIGLCAYGAITFDRRRKVSRVNEAVCKGCGSCAGYCPSGAAQVRHFKSAQIMAEIDGIMNGEPLSVSA